ncbi:MAG: hypothetical protein J0I10_01315 [Verrucomicrobia bacterium]|nr:hypothetical protein [Verrucomicrobiota bacterium]
MKTRHLPLLPILAAASLCLPAGSRAGLIAYESFDQNAGLENPDISADQPDGKPATAGGTGFQPLKVVSGREPLVVTEEGLTFSQDGMTLKTAGRAVRAPGGQSPSLPLYAPYAGDPFADYRSVQNPAAFGREGRTLWVSWLFRVEGDITLQTTAVMKIGSDAIHAGLIHNEKAKEAFFRLISSSTGVKVEPGRTYLAVVRIDYGSKDGGNDKTDRIMLWVNPDLGGSDPGVKPRVTIDDVNAPISSFWFMLGSGDGQASAVFDEIRLGEEYADVVPAS